MESVINLDVAALLWLNQFSQVSPAFDRGVFLLTANEFLKGGLFMTVFWFWWWCKDIIKNRQLVISALTISIFTMASAKLIAKLLPFRERPLYVDLPGFNIPIGVEDIVHTSSSFPSDHAALFASLSIGIYFLSKRWGIVAFAYALFFIMLPRIYLGFHYPSDIFGGILLVFVISIIVRAADFQNSLIVQKLLGLEQKLPSVFYALAFLFTYEMAQLFNHLRSIFSFLKSII